MDEYLILNILPLEILYNDLGDFSLHKYFSK